jgi:hypothetical protein
MKLSCAASNWSARRAERVVLASGMVPTYQVPCPIESGWKIQYGLAPNVLD